MGEGTMACPHCSQRLDLGTQGLFLNDSKKRVKNWREARWKTCPRCSRREGVHVYLLFPAAFGETGLRKLGGKVVPQSDCTFHRQPGQAGARDPKLAGLTCSEGGPQLLRHSEDEPEWTPDELAEPHDCPACNMMIYADDFCDDVCRETYLAGEGVTSLEDGPDPELVAARLRDEISRRQPAEEPEAVEGVESKRLVVHRSRESRLREAKLAASQKSSGGRLRCEVPGCGFDFQEVYGAPGEGYAHVHHVDPLAERSAPTKTRLSDLAVVCANCHAMIHRGGVTRKMKGLVTKARRRAALRPEHVGTER